MFRATKKAHLLLQLSAKTGAPVGVDVSKKVPPSSKIHEQFVFALRIYLTGVLWMVL